MSIRRQLQLSFLLLVLMTTAFVLVVNSTLRRADSEVAVADSFIQIEEKGFALAILATNFRVDPNERRIGQWRNVYGSMGKILAGVEASGRADAFYLDSIARRYREAGLAFERFERLRQGGLDYALITQRRSQAVDEMRANLLQMTDEARLLVSSSMSRAMAEERRATAIAVRLLGALVLFFLAGTMAVSLRITRSLAALGQGVREVEAGNLGRRVDLARRDEFGELAAGFNRMSERLRQSHDRQARQAEALQRANDELEERVRERTEELRTTLAELETRVEERTRELREANQEMEAFSYSVSHDLRAPLRSIEGFSQIILERYEDQVDAQGQDYLRRIRNAVGRMERLIDDILRLSRLSRASMILEEVDLSALAREVVEGLREREPDRTVETTIQPGLSAWADRELLRAILENLIGNGWKFTSKRPDGRVEVGALPGDRDDLFYVRDNGAGFNPAYAHKLFKPFQRLHSEKMFPGTGIGLALVQRIVTRHGGSVRAEGEAGQGATFFFSLPRRDRTHESTALPTG